MPYATQRQHPRVTVSIPVEIRCSSESFARRAQSTNLSLGGCYVEMVQTLESATRLDVVLWINGEKVRAWAAVVTNHQNVGNGIRFVSMLKEDKERLQQFLAAACQKAPSLPHAASAS